MCCGVGRMADAVLTLYAVWIRVGKTTNIPSAIEVEIKKVSSESPRANRSLVMVSELLKMVGRSLTARRAGRSGSESNQSSTGSMQTSSSSRS